MSPIGEALRAAREEKGLALDRVADETNIAKRYLAALEAEDFGVFPGDPYAIGFLRNYAEYLGLASDDLVATFKNLRIQEQPVPIQELIPRRGLSPLAIGGIVAAAAAVLVVGGVLVFGKRGPAVAEIDPADRAPVEYRLEGASFERRLYEGDALVMSLGSDSYKLLLAKIDDAVTLESPVGSNRLLLGEEGTLDLDRNGVPEFKLLVSDFAKKSPAKGAVIRVEYADPALAAAAAAAAPAAAGSAAAAGVAQPATAPAPVLPPAAEPAAAVSVSGKNAVIFEASKSPYPFVLSVTFRGPCMFRYEIDRRDRDERYYHKGETITVNANNSIRIWASNAQAAKVTIQASGGKSADLDLGGAGEVAVKRISWSQGESGGYALSAADVD